MLEKALINSSVDSIVAKLKENGRITDGEIDQLKNVFDSQNLVIGVVGKMKAGKSSLVNAAIFADEILPAGSQPVTVTLTQVSFSEKDEVEITLLTAEDIEDLKRKAAYEGDNPLMIEQSKNATITLSSFPKDYENLILSKNSIKGSLSDLEEFVSAGGKYSGLAKQVSIGINNECLKGITIIDTPGFNDPISSRGETTCKCLSSCNVILFVHNEDGYDQSDEDLLKNQIEYAGISDMVDIFNKIDILHMPFSEWDDQKEYFIEKRDEYLDKFSKECNVLDMVKNSEAILVSSLMALCGQIQKEHRSKWIKNSRATYEEEYDEFCDIADGNNLDDLLIQYSNINAVISAINRIGRNSANYLLEAPLKTLKGKLDSVIESVKSDIEEKEARISSYDANIKSDKEEIKDLEDYSNGIKSHIAIYPLESKIQSSINDTFSKLCTIRSKKSSSEFTEGNYPEPDILTKGVKKQNVARYNLFVSNFEDNIRDSLNDLIRTLKSIINEYVGELTGMLVQKKISDENRKLFKQGLTNDLSSKLNGIIVAITSHVIDGVPTGKQLHWSLFKTNFEKTFSDSYFDQLLDEIREQTSPHDGICDPNIPMYKITELMNEIIFSLQSSPEQKQQAKNEVQKELDALNKELQLYKEYSDKITNLFKSL